MGNAAQKKPKGSKKPLSESEQRELGTKLLAYIDDYQPIHSWDIIRLLFLSTTDQSLLFSLPKEILKSISLFIEDFQPMYIKIIPELPSMVQQITDYKGNSEIIQQ